MSSPVNSRSLLIGACSIVFLALVFPVKANQYVSSNIRPEETSDQVNAAPIWPWEPRNKFQCPSAFGAFPDPEDCGFFYVCVAKIATRKQCKRLQQFDKNLRVCVSFLIAVCDDSGKTKTTKNPETTKTTKGPKTTPGGDDKFTCPGMIGSYLHPTDCTKYYTCTFFIPSLKTCPQTHLFDGVKKECKPADEVHCGTRTRPTDATTIAETTIELETTTPESPSTTAEPPVTTTTPKPRVTAPDTTCPEDDLDCIIDDLGETPDWFVCETDVGSYPHPTSRKLFIFCLNWKPSVKRCGQDLVFSEELMTCVSP